MPGRRAPSMQAPEEPVDVTHTSIVTLSSTRLQMIRALAEGRRTVSDLARALDLHKSTLHAQLQDLVADGLVARHEESTRLWVYYALTRPGTRVATTREVRVRLPEPRSPTPALPPDAGPQATATAPSA